MIKLKEKKEDREILLIMASFAPEIYRFTFSKTFMILLERCAENHRNDSLVDFRRHWDIWKDDHIADLRREKAELEANGYKGNVEQKMFKSVRYYLRNKTEKKRVPKKRRVYISFRKTFLEDMDRHISDVALVEQRKPAFAFNHFYGSSEYNRYMESERLRLKEMDIEEELIENKIKKTYKNRLFRLQRATLDNRER